MPMTDKTLFASEEEELDEMEVDEPMAEEMEVDEMADADASEEIVARSPQETMDYLLKVGRAKGFVSYDDVLKLMPEVEQNIEQLEDIFATLFEQGIAVGQSKEDAIPEIKESGDKAEEDDFDLSQIEIDDSISLYLKEIGRVPLLTAEEEVGLAMRMEAGRDSRQTLSEGMDDWEEREKLLWLVRDGQAATEHLIKANSRLVVSVAKKYVGRGVPFLDLIQ
ncbi:MAG: RNA polymerase subunit sigma, partial [Chloroflexi bacterium]|nr:RNA polymerase subunit sigma [Chloroflexota bacterium]